MSRRLLQLLRGFPRGSLQWALGRAYGRDIVQVVLATEKDLRLLGTSFARQIGETEAAVVKNAAAILEVPYLHRVPDMEFTAPSGGLALNDFREAGSIALTSTRGIIGLVCCNPRLAMQLQLRLGSVPLYLSSWNAISEALTSSEKLLLSRNGQVGSCGMERAERVVELLIQEARAVSQRTIVIRAVDGQLIYEMMISDEQRVTGAIFPAVREQFVQMIQERARCLRPFQTSGPHPSLYTVRELDLEEAYAIDVLGEVFGTAPQETDKCESPAEIPLSEHPSEFFAANRLSLESASEMHIEPPQILIVDDSASFIAVLERFLCRSGFTTLRAMDGREALKVLLAVSDLPTAIICDVHLPGVGGVEFLRKVRSDPRLRALPLIVLSSDDSIELELELIHLGVDAFVAKHRDPRILVAHLRRLTKGPRSLKAA